MKTITVEAPVNIAVIKYWGKQAEDLIIPLNDSISGTLSMDQLCAKTSIALSDSFKENRMWLNGQEVKVEQNKRLLRCLQIVKKLVGVRWPSNQFVHICSCNNFPTAAGLASSAAGYACLMFALGKLFDIEDLNQISSLARLGSGSACRSVFGGFVQWVKGHDSETSIARQIIDENAWPQIRVLILVVNDQRKDTSSTNGMQLTCQTSSLIRFRASQVVPQRIEQMIKALESKDFESFATITMQDSNQFHAVCQDTYPPLRYMNDVSWSVIKLVHFFNSVYGKNVCAYTFDAGPNACIYCLDSHVKEFSNLVRCVYPLSQKCSDSKNQMPLPVNGIQYECDDSIAMNPKFTEYVEKNLMIGAIKHIISTKIGSGPKIITNEANTLSLLNQEGLPKNIASI